MPGPAVLQFPMALVVGFDGSAASRCAATAALDLAERTGSEAHLVTVIRPPESERGAEAVARRLLRDYTTALSESQRNLVSEVLRVGDAATEIAAVATEVAARLAVVGTSHRSGLAKALFGTTVGSLLRRVACPLLITPEDPDAWPPGRVVLGDDATTEARAAGNLAAEIAALYGAAMTLLEAMPVDAASVGWKAEQLARMRELFEDRLEDRADELALWGIRPTIRLVDGAATLELLAALRGDESRRTLVAMGTGRRAGLDSVFHPSVALAVADGARGPALVSPVGEADDRPHRAGGPRPTG
jgi:nucleotide-binding universal stress UspA family protein